MTVRIQYYSDILCVWAYVAQIRLDEALAQFGDALEVDYYFLTVFGAAKEKLSQNWANRGGTMGYRDHVQDVVSKFGHCDIHPKVWGEVIPESSSSCHVFLQGVRGLVAAGEIDAEKTDRLGGRSLFETLIWRFRAAFFEDAVDVSVRSNQYAIAESLDLPLDLIQKQIDSGAAYARHCRELKIAETNHVEGSPTYVLNEGRQKLYGNVGYRVIDANIRELLENPTDATSWC